MVGLAITSVLATPKAAVACSCAGPPPALGAAVARADGAFVGTLTEIGDPEGSGPVISSGRTVLNRFAVEAVAKGDIGPTVVVESAASGASCGLELAVGQRAGIIASRRDGRWSSSLCSKVDADALASLAVLPRTGSGGPTALGENLAVGLVLAALAVALVARAETRTRHDPASRTAAGS